MPTLQVVYQGVPGNQSSRHSPCAVGRKYVIWPGGQGTRRGPLMFWDAL